MPLKSRSAAVLLFIALPMTTLAAAPSSSPPGVEVQPAPGVRLVPIGRGTAKNTVNVVVFRKQSVVTYKDTQFASYYDADGRVVLAKRKLGEDTWDIKTTDLTGTTRDAHNAINIGVDGE